MHGLVRFMRVQADFGRRSDATLKITPEKLSPGCRIALKRSATPRGNTSRYPSAPSKRPSARHPIGKLFAIATRASAVMEMGIIGGTLLPCQRNFIAADHYIKYM
jgi:hypothetical protein